MKKHNIIYKKIIPLLIILFSVLFVNRVAAQDRIIGLSISQESVNDKDTFQMAIRADSILTGSNILGYKFVISYNQNYLEFIEASTTGGIIESWGEPTVNSSQAGVLQIAGASNLPASGSGDLIYLTFYAENTYGGTTGISWNANQTVLNEGTPELVLKNGLVYIATIPKPWISPTSGNMFVGETRELNVSSGVPPYTLTSLSPEVASISEEGLVTALYPGVTRFKVTDSRGSEVITNDFEVFGIKLSVQSVSVLPQEITFVPISIELSPGMNVYSGDIELNLSDGLSGISSSIEPGDFQISTESRVEGQRLKISFAGASPIPGDGVLFRVGIKGETIGQQKISVVSALFDEEFTALHTEGVIEVECQPTVPADNLLPANGVTDQETSLTFYWQPAVNANYYNLFLWEEGEPVPATPFRSSIRTSNTKVTGLIPGKTYNWKIVSMNACSSAESETHSFTVRNFPDLVLTEVIIIPDEILSGGQFDVKFTVKNSGNASTAGKRWRDAVYISTDSAANSSKSQLMIKYNLRQLEPSEAYTQTYSINIPSEYDGEYYIFVRTDIDNSIIELNENNNQKRSDNSLNVTMKPFPDIMVKNITANFATIYPGDSLLINWQVENIGDGDAIGGWRERVTFIPENGARFQLSPFVDANLDLPAGQTVNREFRFKIPDILKFSGKAKIEVQLLPNAALKEYKGTDANNVAVSEDYFTPEDQLFLTIGTSSLSEGSTNNVRCVITRSGSIADDLVVSLNVSMVDQVTVPQTVTIGANASSANFYLQAIDNDIVDGTRFITLTANAANYQSASADMQILDDEATVLQAGMDKYIAHEGDTLHLTISRNLVTNTAVVVNLSTNRPSQWTFNNAATILPNEASVTVPVYVTDDNVPELTEDVSLKISSGGFASDEIIVTIIDDDVPQIDLTLSVDTISEGGGMYAAYGTIERLSGDGVVQVNFSASEQNALILPSSVTLPARARSIQFNIGVVDNNEVDGYRAVDITAAVYLRSCFCTSNAESGGLVTKTIVIADNDGPSLSARVTPAALMEGLDNAGKLIITRNTEPTTALTVNISHNDPAEISLPVSVAMGVGEKSIEVPVTTIDDGVDDGDQLVSVTVSANGYTSGFCSFYVTDSNKPDFVLSDVRLSRTELSSNDTLTVKGWLHNQGYLNAPTGSKVAVYLSKDIHLNESSDERLAEFSTEGQLLKGDSIPFSIKTKLGQHTGEYYFLVHANPLSKVAELVYNNNTYQPIKVSIDPEYSATAQVDITQTLQNTPVAIQGKALNSSNQPVPNAEVDVYLTNNGTRKVLKARTDESGNYNIEFNPLPGESGHYGVGACFPGQITNEAQDSFDILGVNRTSTAYITWFVKRNEAYNASIQIKNTSNTALTNVRLTGENLPEGCTITSTPIATLAGNKTATLHYSVLGTEQSPGSDYHKLNVSLVSDEGVTEDFVTYYFCQEQQATLVTNISTINTTVIKDGAKFIDFTLINQGAGESGKISVELPKTSYLTLVSSDTVSNLKTGEGATITLKLTDDGLPLHTPASGRIAFNCENGKGTTLSYKVEAVSNAKGVVRIDVVDEYTYNTAEAPHLKDAHVVLKHPFSGSVVAEGFTGADGIFETDSIPEGYYTITIEAEKHEGYRNNLYVIASKTYEQTIFLSFQAITYSWEVVPTEIEDEYDIDLILTFETNVPAPVVLVEGPDEYPELIGDETFPFLLTVTNKGLITANNVNLILGEDGEYEFLTPYKTMDLLAQQSIQIPVVMKRKAVSDPPGAPGRQNAVASSDNCFHFSGIDYRYECGPHTQYRVEKIKVKFSGRICNDGLGGGIWGPDGEPRLKWGGGSDTPSSMESSVSVNKITDCYNCIEDLGLALLGCIPGWTSLALNTINCVKSLRSSTSTAQTIASIISCGVGYHPVYGCVAGLGGAALDCYRGVYGGFRGGAIGTGIPVPIRVKRLSTTDDKLVPMPPIIAQAMEDLTWFTKNAESDLLWMEEVTGIRAIYNRVNFFDFIEAIDPFFESRTKFSAGDIQLIKDKLEDTDFTSQEIENYANRWNVTMDAHNTGVYVPNNNFPDIINDALLEEYVLLADSAYQYAVQRGYEGVMNMGEIAYQTIADEVDGGKSSVCASITIKISQKMTMTREAFEGTLTVENGHQTIAMKNIKLNLEVKDQNGVICNDLFQINTKALSVMTGIEGDGELAATKKGSASILFIPTKHAAPELPTSYSFGGSFSYVDPFSGLEVTKQLFPVTLDVHPSPDLFLHYFMQRDVYGDDPMTEEIEPIIPAELALMIKNDGFGPAKNVKVESAQPEIIENQKGLAIKLALVGSNLNGQERQMGINNIDFGDIAPKSTAIGQWWFTSNLLGHFTHYETRVVHANSYGNPELSLVSGASLHELIKSIRVYKDDDGINDFLVNEIQDADETPDVIYTSQGEILEVHPVKNISLTGDLKASNLELELAVEPKFPGWNYGRLSAVGGGAYKLDSVIRISDNFALPKDNVWQTHVTLPDGEAPVYEYKFHFVDEFASIDEEKYRVTYLPDNIKRPAILRIEGVPEKMSSTPVTTVRVVFESPIDETTFTIDVMTLYCQDGPNLIDNTVTITKIDDTNYDVDISKVALQDGFYVLTVATDNISNEFGDKGYYGKQVSWTQYASTPVILEFIGLPEENRSVSNVLDYFMVEFSVPIDLSTFVPEHLAWTHNGSTIESDVQISAMDEELKLFKISGLEPMQKLDGCYEMLADLTKVKSQEGVYGALSQSVKWKYDTTHPFIKEVNLFKTDGFDTQHVTSLEVIFNEPVEGFSVSMLELWRDSNEEPLSQLNFSQTSDSTYLITDFRLLAYYEADYTLKFDLTQIIDYAGNSGRGVYEKSWTVNRTAPLAVTELRISPDNGFSATDGITSTGELYVSMRVNAPDARILVYYNSLGEVYLLADTLPLSIGLFTVPIRIPLSGSMKIRVETMDRFGNVSMSEIPVYIDDAPLSVSWDNIPTEVSRIHPESVLLRVSDKLLNEEKLRNSISCTLNGESVVVDNLVLTPLSESENEYVVGGFGKLGVQQGGKFTISVNASLLSKYSSGRTGARSYETSWQLRGNKPPVAVAGEDIFGVKPGAIIALDGSASYDDDFDPISYRWIAPTGISLSSTTIANPTFIIPEDFPGYSLTFQLVVNDGVFDSEVSELTVYLLNETGTKPALNFENKIKVAPNPSKGDFVIYFNEDLNSNLVVRIYDMVGELVYLQDIDSYNLMQAHRIEGASLKPGVYMIDVRDHKSKPIGLQKLIISN